jgi:Na+/melibiose symporter-like transporter
MEGFKVDINDILRFTGIGIFIIFIVGYENMRLLAKAKDFGAVSIILLSFIIGNIFYYIYRSLIYSTIILRLKDKFLKDQKYYSRSYFKSKLGCSSTKDANNFFYYLRTKCALKALTKESSSVHLMYMTSIILVFYFVYKLYLTEYVLATLFLALAWIIMLAAFLTDRLIEKYDYNQIREIPLENLYLYWKEYRTNQDDESND